MSSPTILPIYTPVVPGPECQAAFPKQASRLTAFVRPRPLRRRASRSPSKPVSQSRSLAKNPDHDVSTICAAAGPIIATAHHSAIRAEQTDVGIHACAAQRGTEPELLPSRGMDISFLFCSWTSKIVWFCEAGLIPCQMNAYKAFAVPFGKVFLGAVLTYQIIYWIWVKLETDEVKLEKNGRLSLFHLRCLGRC